MNMNDIKVVIVDVDGCLSDGTYEVNSDGIMSKKFYTRDFYGIEQLLNNNIRVLIITQSSDDVIKKQCRRINEDREKRHTLAGELFEYKIELYTNVENKIKKIRRIRHESKYSFSWDDMAYIGDAENDLECMKEVGFTACPCDAIDEIKEESNYICDAPGGKGAVYEFCKYILKNKGKKSENS